MCRKPADNRQVVREDLPEDPSMGFWATWTWKDKETQLEARRPAEGMRW